ncbi:MAG TPA: intradiol ring-cleavage dioxygenase, partial [Chloroflexota bacterium]
MSLVLPAIGVLAACGAPTSAGILPASPAPSSGTPVSAGVPQASASRAAASPVASTSAAAAAAAGSCSLSPEQEVGPYYLANQQIRKDVTEGRPGVPLQLHLTLLNAGGCSALPNAAVDIWHADATGNYSGFSNAGGSGTFLRGTQLTDGNGLAEFSTIYPGWYPGRAIHIHVRVHTGGSTGPTYSGGHIAHTGQLFPPEDMNDQVMKLAPYSSHTGNRTIQSRDGVFTGQHGSDFVLKLTPLKQGDIAAGFLATATLVVDPNPAPAPVGV